VSVIDTATNTVTATVAIGASPYGVAVSPDGSHAFVTDYSEHTVFVINTATNAFAGVINVGGTPYEVAFSPDGSHAYVTTSNGVSVISL